MALQWWHRGKLARGDFTWGEKGERAKWEWANRDVTLSPQYNLYGSVSVNKQSLVNCLSQSSPNMKGCVTWTSVFLINQNLPVIWLISLENRGVAIWVCKKANDKRNWFLMKVVKTLKIYQAFLLIFVLPSFVSFLFFLLLFFFCIWYCHSVFCPIITCTADWIFLNIQLEVDIKSRAHARAHTHTHTHSLSLSSSLSHTHTHTHTHTLTHTSAYEVGLRITDSHTQNELRFLNFLVRVDCCQSGTLDLIYWLFCDTVGQ